MFEECGDGLPHGGFGRLRADGQGCASQAEGVDDRRVDAAGQHHGDIHPGRREFVVQRFAKVEHIRLGRAVVGHVRQSLDGAQRDSPWVGGGYAE
jgi:hypothetical protein